MVERTQEQFNPDGLGMGLNICQQILQKCNGNIEVSSQGENQGSTFKFQMRMHLPRQDSPSVQNGAVRNDISLLLREEADDSFSESMIVNDVVRSPMTEHSNSSASIQSFQTFQAGSPPTLLGDNTVRSLVQGMASRGNDLDLSIDQDEELFNLSP